MPERKKPANIRPAVSNGRGTSEEYERFESLMKRLVRTPKKDVDARREDERKRA